MSMIEGERLLLVSQKSMKLGKKAGPEVIQANRSKPVRIAS